MKVTIMFGTSIQNITATTSALLAELNITDLLTTNRLDERYMHYLVQGLAEQESEVNTLVVTDDASLSLLAMNDLAQSFPEIVSIRWSGKPAFEVIDAFRNSDPTQQVAPAAE